MLYGNNLGRLLKERGKYIKAVTVAAFQDNMKICLSSEGYRQSQLESLLLSESTDCNLWRLKWLMLMSPEGLMSPVGICSVVYLHSVPPTFEVSLTITQPSGCTQNLELLTDIISRSWISSTAGIGDHQDLERMIVDSKSVLILPIAWSFLG